MTEDTLSSTHPPTPPTTEEDRFSWLRLLRSRRVGVATFYRLLAEHGSAQNALEALPEVARQAGIDGYEICPAGVVDAELKAARVAKARLLCLGAPSYPPLLAEISDPPPMLWALGDVALAHRPTVAMVGARNASSLGLRMARRLSREMGAAGLVIASGLARGIDAAAHESSMETGSIAVVAGGVDTIYPEENRALTHDLRERGLILSDQPMGLKPMARHFPRRNRLIAGLSHAVLVIEAAAKSGSLITARDALDLGRDVLAVPGHPIDPRSSGGNLLIREGATLIRNIDDVIEAIGTGLALHTEPPPAPTASQPELPRPKPTAAEADLHQEILNRLGPTPVAPDQVLRDLPHPYTALSAALSDLEIDGHIARDPGGLIRRQN